MPPPQPTPPSLPQLTKHILPRLLISLAIWGGLLFGAAGILAWPRAWVQLALWLPTMFINIAVLVRVNPALVAARLNRQQVAARFEKLMLPFFVVTIAAIPVIAGFDAVRLGWSQMPLWALWAGLLLHVGGDALMVWAMAVNPFLLPTIHVQTDRGHRVITTGPYATVRHPMYTGLIILLIGMPLILGSWWTFIPIAALTLGVIIRTICEEALLHRDLPGYEDYTRRTRYRLVPGVW